MKKLLWRIELFALVSWFGYVPKHRRNLVATWRWTGEECWLGFFNDNYSPKRALYEDMSEA